MKKILEKLFVIIIAFIFIYMYIGINNEVFGASVSVSSSSVDIGGTTTISVSIPDGYVAYEGTVSFDSSKLSYVSSSCGNLVGGNVKVADANTNLGQVSNFSITFQGNVEGNANVSVNLILADENANSVSASGSGSITIKSQEAPPPVENPTTNNPTPNSGNSGDSSSNNPTPPVQKEPNFSQVNETVYATKSMNVRSSWSTSSSKIGGLASGQAVTRTGIGDNGWSRISYNGKTAYVSTSLITTTKPEEPESEEPESPEDTESESEEQNPEENLETPEENNETSVEDELYQKIVNEIGTIPEVGNNINKYIFGVVILLSVISIMIIFRKEA